MTNDNDEDLLSTGGAFGVLAEVARSDVDNLIGREVGDYRITGLIAEGGMGRVYRAERTDGSFDRDVAIKVSLASRISKDLRQRFLREQQILADMNHPSVARLYDAGTSDDGFSYIIMELLDGQDITSYVDGRRLTQRQVIELVLPLLDALAFAHSRLVVHRDIKPSNVVVDEQGKASLLDFGIAKLLEESPEAATNARPLTLTSASPEQLLGGVITVASDIYQVGLLLHRLLLGEDALPQRTLSEAVNTAMEAKPHMLSASARQTLAPDLAAILSHCLQPDPADRYRDMNTLRDDLRKFLENRPVSVTEPSLSYRLRKLVRRNPGLSVAVTTLLAVIIGGTVLYTIRINDARLEAEREAAIAEEVITFLTDVFEVSDPQKAMGESVSARELLDRGAQMIDEEFPDRPVIRARLQHVIGGVFREMGLYNEAVSLNESAYALRREYLGMDNRDTLIAGNDLAIVYDRLDRYEEAVAIYKEVLARQRELHGSDDIDTMKTINNMGTAHISLAEYEIALEYLEEAYERRGRVLGNSHTEYATTVSNLPIVYANLGQLDKAEEMFLESVATSRRINGDNHPSTILALANTASLYIDRGMYEEAKPVLDEAWERAVLVIGESGYVTIWIGVTRATLLSDRAAPTPDDLREAEDLAQLVGLRATETLGPDNTLTLEAKAALARIWNAQGRHEEALALCEAILLTRLGSLSENHPKVINARSEVAATFVELQRIGEAVDVYEAIDKMLVERFDADHPDRLENLQHLGNAHALLGNSAQAEALYRESVQRFSVSLGDDDPMTVGARATLDKFLEKPQTSTNPDDLH